MPDKFHLRITFLEEPPFVVVSEPDPVSAKCSINRGVSCLVPSAGNGDGDDGSGGGGGGDGDNVTAADADPHYVSKCCSGMCVDLLRKFEDELKFTYELVRVADPKFGTLEVRLTSPHPPYPTNKWPGRSRSEDPFPLSLSPHFCDLRGKKPYTSPT